jgi:3-hydroxyisobutyrate dehydrogenase-like beta-hydroxyacid dehydrogenase
MHVALAGTGLMGTAIAERLLDAGHELTVYNRTAARAQPLVDRGASLAPSADALLAADADLCITMLADDQALLELITDPGGILAGARAGTTLVDMSTVSVAASKAVAAAAEQAGVAYLRAPVSGNPTVVRAGNLTIVVSGPRDVYERAEGLLREIGPTVYYAGDAEQARVVKLALQVMIGGTAELMSEALVLGAAGGVEPSVLLEVMAKSAVGSPFVTYKTAPLLNHDYSATFTTAMMAKDVGLVLDLGAENGVELPFTEELASLLRKTIEQGHADEDFMALYLSLRRAAGLDDEA